MNTAEAITNEQFYLGCILNDSSLMGEAKLTNQHFIKGEHRTLFTTLKETFDDNQSFDLGSIQSLGNKTLDSCGGLKYISDMAMSVPSIYGFQNYEKILASFHEQREIQKKSNEYLFEAAEDPFNREPLQKFMKSVSELESLTSKQSVDFKEQLKNRFSYHDALPVEGLSGIDTGFEALNKTTEGFQNSDLVIVGARPSMGKTAFALNSILNSQQNNDNILSTLFSVEMAEGPIIDRMIATRGRINLMRMKNPKKYFMGQDQLWEKYTRGLGELNQFNIQLRRDYTVPEIRTVMRKTVRDNPDKKNICFIDFLTLIKGTEKKQSRHHEIEEIILDLKNMAADLNIPVIVLAQLSRRVEQRENKRPMLSDLRESGSIEQTADMVMFLYRDDYYNAKAEPKGLTEILIAKHRNGSTGKVRLMFTAETNTFSEIDKYRPERGA